MIHPRLHIRTLMTTVAIIAVALWVVVNLPGPPEVIIALVFVGFVWIAIAFTIWTEMTDEG